MKSPLGITDAVCCVGSRLRPVAISNANGGRPCNGLANRESHERPSCAGQRTLINARRASAGFPGSCSGWRISLCEEYSMSQIGEPLRIIEVEPLEEPVPEKEVPFEQPADPVKEPA